MFCVFALWAWAWAENAVWLAAVVRCQPNGTQVVDDDGDDEDDADDDVDGGNDDNTDDDADYDNDDINDDDFDDDDDDGEQESIYTEAGCLLSPKSPKKRHL